MMLGWTRPFQINRRISQEEMRSHFLLQKASSYLPDPYGALIRFNSEFCEMIDCSERQRGMAKTLVCLLGIFVLFVFGISVFFMLLSDYLSQAIGFVFFLVFVFVFAVVTGGGGLFLWQMYLRYEFFSWRYFPVRFNRMSGKVFVFRSKEFGGVLALDWGDIYWHIGTDGTGKICTLRGHVLNGSTVVETFSVGNFFHRDEVYRILSLWCFLEKYMEHGPQDAAPAAGDEFIYYSTKVSFRNCFVRVVSNLSPLLVSLRHKLFFLYYPILFSLVLTQWLVLKSCREPRWPEFVEKSCAPRAKKSFAWVEPERIGQFLSNDLFYKRLLEKEQFNKNLFENGSGFVGF
ncbi:DUF6708 domain-containing protein [uncultured Salinicola sp.]|uniref:DUF6708 domain-containing protein n=1 Tax=uncultured Salinicola sp. TaxID=1193542 RepID=UPI00261C60F5|nr:DUF6708 domain-containing protein [uncultured Salinicola sp.]|tara:strand:- start:3595 stop:4632 length:1038 start_codon:yes stop_codon:yes gene_type:complete